MGGVNKNQELYFATWLRVIAMSFIVIGHCVCEHPNAYMKMSFQFFSIANNIFFILSGFLFGMKGIGEKRVDWFVKRAKRIFIPWEFYVATIALITIVYGGNVLSLDWLLMFLGCQGTDSGIYGTTHTWFVSAILLCYLFTPLISIIVKKCSNSTGKKVMTLLVALAIPVLLAFCREEWIHTLFSSVIVYGIAFYAGTKYNGDSITRGIFAWAIVLMLIAFSMRIVGRYFYDGTIFYNKMIVYYTQAIGASCIFLIILYLFHSVKPLKFVSLLSDISFEVYLYHYIFILGPISVMFVPNWYVGVLLVFLLSIVTAFIMYKMKKKINIFCK